MNQIPIRKLLLPYAEAGYQLFPLQFRGKIPANTGWREHDYTQFDFEAWHARGGNIGIRLQPHDLIIDCDPRNYQPNDDPVDRLSELARADLRRCPTTITGSGGLHLFYRKPENLRISGKLEGFDGVDFLTAGKLIVAPGSIHPTTGQSYRIDETAHPIGSVALAPPLLLQRLEKQQKKRTSASGEISADQLKRILHVIDPARFGVGRRPEWIAFSAACHDATGGDSEAEGVWLEWCADDPDFCGLEDWERNEATWASFTAGRERGSGLGTLLWTLRKIGREDIARTIQSEVQAERSGSELLEFIKGLEDGTETE